MVTAASVLSESKRLLSTNSAGMQKLANNFQDILRDRLNEISKRQDMVFEQHQKALMSVQRNNGEFHDLVLKKFRTFQSSSADVRKEQIQLNRIADSLAHTLAVVPAGSISGRLSAAFATLEDEQDQTKTIDIDIVVAFW